MSQIRPIRMKGIADLIAEARYLLETALDLGVDMNPRMVGQVIEDMKGAEREMLEAAAERGAT